MFNWLSAPGFVAMLIFWLLTCYVLTRGKPNRLSWVLAGWQASVAAFFLNQVMQSNAATLQEWYAWAYWLQWSIIIAPQGWYWVTVLLQSEPTPATRRYLHRIAYPLGALFAIATVALLIAAYATDWIWIWSRPITIPPERVTTLRFDRLPGPWFPALVALSLVSVVASLVNVWRARQSAAGTDRRRLFDGLLVGALLIVVGVAAAYLGNASSSLFWLRPLSQTITIVAALVIALNVDTYSLLLQGRVIRTDLLYFLTAMGLICLLYGLVAVLAEAGTGSRLVPFLVLLLLLAVLSHAGVDVMRRLLDRVFYERDVQRLRSELAAAAESAPLFPNLATVLGQARSGIDEAATEHLVRLTEEALRRLNTPAALAQCELIRRLPRTLAATRRNGPPVTPLEQAQALREVLVAAIERLQLPSAPSGKPGALGYTILREEYLVGLPNKEIRLRHGLSEGTFNRYRRSAVAILARELSTQEERLNPLQNGSAPLASDPT